MPKPKFPSQNTDQPLVVFAHFTISKGASLDLLRDYVGAWIDANKSWTRILRSNVVTVERLDYYAEFLSKPLVQSGTREDAFFIKFVVKPHATRWKDFAVHLTYEIEKAFHEVKFIGMKTTENAADDGN